MVAMTTHKLLVTERKRYKQKWMLFIQLLIIKKCLIFLQILKIQVNEYKRGEIELINVFVYSKGKFRFNKILIIFCCGMHTVGTKI
jgi:hypothetical protein